MILRICFVITGLAAVLLLGACRRDAVRVYTVAKEEPAPLAEPKPEHDPDHAPDLAPPQSARQPRPQATWKVPPGWQQVEPGSVNLARFAVKGEAGEADISIASLARMAGMEPMVVNMWREELGQPPLSAEQSAAALSPVAVAGGEGLLFEVAGSKKDKASRTVTVMLHRPDTSWFFKLTGPEAVVAEQKPAFVEFLKTVQIGQAQPGPGEESH